MAKKFLSDIELDAGLVDVNGNKGTSGQILSSTGESVDWIDQGDIIINEAEVAKSLQVTVKNISGAQLTKGTVVHASPTASPPSGNVIEVIAADNDDPAKMPAIGILNETIADEAEGEAIMMGALSGIDTDSFAAGDELYVGADGALTNAKPTDADELIQKIAVVIKSHASNGLIKIFGAGRSNDIPNVGAATTDTDKFVVLDSGALKYRTGAEIISDLPTDTRYVAVTGDTMTGTLTASGGINGLTLSNGISGSNFNITGVNQLTINDPGEGIAFGGGSAGTITLAVVDDSNDNLLRVTGTNAKLQVGTNEVFHDGYHPNADTWTTGRTITIGDTGKSVNGSADVSWSLSEIGAAASSHNHDSDYVNVTGDTMTGDLNIGANLSLTGDTRILNLAGGSTTSSQSRLIIGEQGTYGVSFRWNSGAELEFDGFWNSSVTGSRNRDLGSIDVNNRIWYLNNNVSVGGDLTVSGGDITLSGTGRIQGIDTVSAGTDAANKTYVDNAVSGLVTSVSSGDGIVLTGTSTAAVVNIDYTGIDNAILSAVDASGSTINTGAKIWYSDDATIAHANVSDLPFASSSHNHDSDYVNVTGDAMTGNLGIGTSGPPTAYSLQTSSNILSGGSVYFGNTQNSIFDYSGTLHIYAGNGNNITLGGGVGSIQNDVSIGNGTFRVNGSTRMGTGNPTEKLDVDGNVKADGFTSDGNAYSYAWRALDNTGNSGTRYQKIARITSSQSSRFVIELAGRSTSYGDNSLPALGYIVGQLNNDNNYDLVFYNHSGEDTVVDEVGQVDVSTTQTDIYIKVSSFSEVTAHAHISDGSIAVESTSAGGTEPSNYVAATNITVWNSRNDGSGSGLDADLLDGQQASDFASSSHNHDGDYVELTGDTMSGPLVIDEADTDDKWLFRVDNNGSNFSGFWSASEDIQLYLRDDAGNVRIHLRPDARSLFYDGLDASILYDSDNTSYYVNPASTSTALNAPLGSARVKDVFIGNSSGQISNRVWFNNGSTNQPGLYFEGGQPKFIIYTSVSNIFHDTYHPNADTWTTGRTITIGSTGKSVNGSADVSWSLSEIGAAASSHEHTWAEINGATSNSINGWGGLRHTTNSGYIDFGPANSSHAHIYTDRPDFYLNKRIQISGGSQLNASDVRSSIFYDLNNTGYFFNGNASKDNVDLTSGGNHAINVLGTISGGHRKHNNLETPEMEWSVGGSTDLNWKKLCDIVISDNNYSGWGAEIEITDFSGNYGNAMYGGGELFKGALSIYHWGGTGDTTETAYANIPYEMRSHVRWYKINESGQNRYQLQVKSPANYQQLYVKVKPGIGNQIADIISYANDTNGITSGGTAYASIQNSNFNHEFAGSIWTNDNRTIGWKNAYGSPHFSSYYGSITTNTPLYVGGTTSTTTNLYSGYSRASVFYDRNSSTYYMDGSSTGDSIRVAGDVVAYYSSDKRYKENIKPIENALDKVKAINGVTFNWNEKSHKETGRKDVGVIAQEVEEVLPEIVETRRNGYKAVDYQKLAAVLIESVKELTAKVEALEAKQCNCK